jgi:hypothetical protein
MPMSKEESVVAASAICGATNPTRPATDMIAVATTRDEDFLPFARLVSAAATKVPVFSHQMLLYDLFIDIPQFKKINLNSNK